MTESAIKEVFIGEAKEIIEKLESDLVQLEENEGDQEIVNRIFRSFHTLKGSSGIVGLTSVYGFSHRLENLLDLVRSGKVTVERPLIDLVLDSIDWIRDELFEGKEGTEESRTAVEELVKRVSEFTGEEQTVATEAAEEEKAETKKQMGGYGYFRVRAAFRGDIFSKGIDPLMIIEDLLSIGTLISKSVNREKIPPFEEMDPEQCYLSWDVIIKTLEPIEKIEDVFVFVKDENDITIEDVSATFAGRGRELLHEKRIGEILLEKGLITEAELDDVIRYHDAHATKIGDIIVKKGLATREGRQGRARRAGEA